MKESDDEEINQLEMMELGEDKNEIK